MCNFPYIFSIILLVILECHLFIYFLIKLGSYNKRRGKRLNRISDWLNRIQLIEDVNFNWTRSSSLSFAVGLMILLVFQPLVLFHFFFIVFSLSLFFFWRFARTCGFVMYKAKNNKACDPLDKPKAAGDPLSGRTQRVESFLAVRFNASLVVPNEPAVLRCLIVGNSG